MLIVHPDSHVHADLKPAHVAWALKKFGDRDSFFKETVEMPESLPALNDALYGPSAGDPPITESEVVYVHRGGKGKGKRLGKSRMVNLPLRKSRRVTVIAGPHDGHPMVVYAMFGGHAAEREPFDEDIKNEADRQRAVAFWATHALATGKKARKSKPEPRDNAPHPRLPNMARTSKTSLHKLEQDFLASSPYVLDMATSSIRKRDNTSSRRRNASFKDATPGRWQAFYAGIDKALPGDVKVPIRAMADAVQFDRPAVFVRAVRGIAVAILPHAGALLPQLWSDTPELRVAEGLLRDFAERNDLTPLVPEALAAVERIPDGLRRRSERWVRQFANALISALTFNPASNYIDFAAFGELAGLIARLDHPPMGHASANSPLMWENIDSVLAGD